MPAYNEEEGLSAVLDGWYPLIEDNPDNRLIVLNDGSTDSTMDVISSYANTHPQLIGIDKPNSGHGATIYDGYKIALDSGADLIFQTDSDGQTSPDEFAAFRAALTKNGSYDVVLGYRSGRQDGASRVVVTNVLRLVVRLTMGAKVKDANVPYRLMTRNALSRALEYVPDHHNLTNIVLSAAFHRQGFKVCTVPVSFRKRGTGVNSLNMPKITRIGVKALRDFAEIGKKLAPPQPEIEAGYGNHP